MKEIRKFELSDGVTEIEAPIVKFLTVQVQAQTPCLWAVVDTDRTAKKFKISSVIPGWDMGDINPDKYIGTIQIGGFVWHYFWEGIRTPTRLKEKIKDGTFTVLAANPQSRAYILRK